MNNEKEVVVEAKVPPTTQKKKRSKDNNKEIKIAKEELYKLYLAVEEYKFKLDKKEYTTEEDGRILLGTYRDRNLAMQNALKYINKGLLVSLIVN